MDLNLTRLKGLTVAVRTDRGQWFVGVVKWGGKSGHRVVTDTGKQIKRNAIREVVLMTQPPWVPPTRCLPH